DQHAVAEALERGPRGLESILLRQRCVAYVASATHVPFAEVAGGVTGVAERSGDARRGWIEPIAHSVLAIDFARVKIRVDQVPRRTLAGGEADARRRADRCGAVELAEANAFPADRVHARRRHVAIAGDAQVAVAEIVHQDEDNVGPARRQQGRGG